MRRIITGFVGLVLLGTLGVPSRGACPGAVLPPECWAAPLVYRDSVGGPLGWSLDVADVTGDGLLDLIVGRPIGGGAGAVVLFAGTPSGFDAVPRQRWDGPPMFQGFGGLVRAVGDVDGDGFGDVVVVSSIDPYTQSTRHVWLLRGGATGFVDGSDWTTISGIHALAVDGVGDINGDGHADVALSRVPGPWPADTFPRDLVIVHGSASGLAPTPSQVIAPDPLWGLGGSIVGGNDLDQDGYADLVVTGTDRTPPVAIDRAWVFRGGPGGFSSMPTWDTDADGIEASGRGQADVSPDLNGDGYPELVIGEPRAVLAPPSGSQFRIWSGEPGGVAGAPWRTTSEPARVRGLGRVVAPAGDVDGDGFQDLVVLAWEVHIVDACPFAPAMLFLYYGGPAGLDNAPGRYAQVDIQRLEGQSITINAADVNGDGLGDVVIGLETITRVHVYLGSHRNRPPTCSSPAVVVGSCRGIPLPATADDPDGDPLQARWTTSCPGARFSPHPNVLNPVVTFDPCGSIDCDVTLSVFDGRCSVATSTTRLMVGDSLAPVLVGVPPGEIASCDAVPAPAIVTAVDDCDPAPSVTFAERRLDGPCPWEHELIRTWRTSDACGNGGESVQSVKVVDREAPVIAPVSPLIACLWPPNGRLETFSLGAFSPTISDNCDPAPAWRLLACVPEEAGLAVDPSEATVAADGSSVTVRVRRSGMAETGRLYRVFAIATDACGNDSVPTQVGSIRVPHDSRPGDRCR